MSAKNFIAYPKSTKEFHDIKEVISKYVLPGFIPENKIFGAGDYVMTHGSCFAHNLAEALGSYNVEVIHFNVKDYINTTYANKVFFQYATGYENSIRQRNLETLKNKFSQALFKNLIDGIKLSKVLILTVGVAPCWFEKSTGNVVLDIDKKNLNNYEFKTTGVDWNVKNLLEIIKIVREINPKLHITLTVSPVPLNKSFDMESTVVTDCVSKSVLRVTVHTLLKLGIANLNYWPSFEIVRWIGSHIDPVYGNDDDHPRHVSRDLVAIIVDLFINGFGDDTLEVKG